MSAPSELKEVLDQQHEYAGKDKDLYSLSSAGASVDVPNGIDTEVAQFFADTTNNKPVEIDDATNRRLRWLIHRRVLVVMVVTYFAQTLDKGTLNFASIMGIVEDNHLHGQQYAWLTTCVYIAILIWELPANRLIQRLPVAKFLAFNIFAWGTVLACTAACSNFAGLVVVRTLLGVFECVCQPAFVFMSAMWYRREEQALVIGAFYSMNGFQQCVGGLLAYGISQIQGQALKNWQILFTLLGCITVAWSVFVFFWLPDSPMSATCFSKEDRILMVERVRANETGIQNREFKMHQVWEAVKEPVIWCVTLISFTNALPTGGLGAFSNIILKQFGFTQLQTYLLAIAQGAIIMSFLFGAATLSKRFNQRLLFAFIFTLPNIIGTIVFLTVTVTPSTKVGLLIAFYCTQGFGAVAVLNLAVMTGNVAGRTKQVIASTFTFVAWAVGNAVGPQVFQANDGPRYIKAFVAHIVMYAVQCATIVFLRGYLMRRNAIKRRNAQAAEVDPTANGEGSENVDHKHAFEDMTDRENPDFRYVY